MRPSSPDAPDRGPGGDAATADASIPHDAQRGSAVVEFTFLSALLMVPLVYFIITMGQLQGGSFAVVGAADQAAKVFVAQTDAGAGRAAAEQAVLLALADHGHAASNARSKPAAPPRTAWPRDRP